MLPLAERLDILTVRSPSAARDISPIASDGSPPTWRSTPREMARNPAADQQISTAGIARSEAGACGSRRRCRHMYTPVPSTHDHGSKSMTYNCSFSTGSFSPGAPSCVVM
jgi:hypothetical protein